MSLLKNYSPKLAPLGTGSTNITESDKFHWRAAFALQRVILVMDKKTSITKITQKWEIVYGTKQ